MSWINVKNVLHKVRPIRLEDPPIPEEVAKSTRQKIVDLTYCMAAVLIYFFMVAVSLAFVYFLYTWGEDSLPRVKQSNNRFKAHCNIPFVSKQLLHYDMKNNKYYVEEPQFFGEQFEIGLKEQPYVKILVEDFPYSRMSIFIHDFLSNYSAIISHQDSNCFVLPLDKKFVMSPERLLHRLKTVATGEDYSLLQIKTIDMSVLLPKMNHFKYLGEHILKECKGYSMFKLQPALNSTEIILDPMLKYAYFAGFNVISYSINGLNIDDKSSRKKREDVHALQKIPDKMHTNNREAEKEFLETLIEELGGKIEVEIKILHEVPNVVFCKVA